MTFWFKPVDAHHLRLYEEAFFFFLLKQPDTNNN